MGQVRIDQTALLILSLAAFTCQGDVESGRGGQYQNSAPNQNGTSPDSEANTTAVDLFFDQPSPTTATVSCPGCDPSDLKNDLDNLGVLVKWIQLVLKDEGFTLNCGYLSTAAGDKCHDFVSRINGLLDGTQPATNVNLAGIKPISSFKCIKIMVKVECGSFNNHVSHAAVCKGDLKESIIAEFDFWKWGEDGCFEVGPSTGNVIDAKGDVRN
jgi:hypothetical protein